MVKKNGKVTKKINGFLIISINILFFYFYLPTLGADDILNATGARAAGMAGAFTAISNDFSSFFWNPAGIVLNERVNINIYYDFIFKGQQVNYGGNYTHLLPENMAIALSYLKNTYSQSAFESDTFYLSYSSFLDDKKLTSGGINLKFINKYFKGYQLNASATGVDMGFMYFPDFFENKLRFGLLIQDIDTTLSWNNNVKEKMPVVFKLGSVFMPDETVNIALDIDIVHNWNKKNDKRELHFGLEKWFLSRGIGNFGFRAGINWKESTTRAYKLTFGFSYGREDFVFNYVYIPDFDYLNETHKVDFTYFLGEKIKAVYKEELPEAKMKPEEIEGILKIVADKFSKTDLIISTKYFSPNNDNKNDKILFMIKNYPSEIKDAKWFLQIQDKTGVLVKEFGGSGIKTETIIWDGSSINQGGIVKEGNYTAIFRVIYKDKEMVKIIKVISVDITPPVFDQKIYPKIFAPIENSNIKDLQVLISSKFRDIDSWTMLVKDETGNTIRKFSGNGFIDKLMWDGKDALDNTVKDGKYKIIFTMRDFAGNEYSLSEQFVVDTSIIRVKVNLRNRMFKVGENKVNFLVGFDEPEKIKKWDLEILDNKNNIIKSYRNKGAGVRLITWDGTNDKNEYQREGEIYRYKLLITQKNEIVIRKEGLFQSVLPKFIEVGLQLTLAAIDFADMSYEIPVEEYTYLNKGAEALKKYAKNYMLFIKGYATDYEGDAEKNLKLSIERVLAVKNYMVKYNDIPEENIYINAYGDGEYFDFLTREEIMKTGRRVELELITK